MLQICLDLVVIDMLVVVILLNLFQSENCFVVIIGLTNT